MPPTSWHKAAFVCLFSMILMRLVWVQLRNYDLHYGDMRTQVFFDEVLPHHPSCSGIYLTDNIRRFEIAPTPEILRTLPMLGQSFFFAVCALNHNELSPGSIEKANQILFFLVVFLGAALVRLLSQSWIFAMAAAVIILSRGHLITRVEVVGIEPVIQVLVLSGFVMLLHFLKSGSIWSFSIFVATMILASFLDIAACALLLSLPCLLMFGFLLRRLLMQPLLHRLRSENLQMQQLLQRGGLKLYKGGVINGALSWLISRLVSRPEYPNATGDGVAKIRENPRFWSGLSQPFSLWVFQRRRWLAFTLIQMGFFSIVLVLYTQYHQEELKGLVKRLQSLPKSIFEIFLMWMTPAAEVLDIHLAVSIMLAVICMLLSPAKGLPRMFEAAWALVVSLVLLLFFGFCFDLILWIGKFGDEALNFSQSIYLFSRSDSIILWLEPVFLCFGLIAIYQLILVGEEKK